MEWKLFKKTVKKMSILTRKTQKTTSDVTTNLQSLVLKYVRAKKCFFFCCCLFFDRWYHRIILRTVPENPDEKTKRRLIEEALKDPDTPIEKWREFARSEYGLINGKLHKPVHVQKGIKNRFSLRRFTSQCVAASSRRWSRAMWTSADPRRVKQSPRVQPSRSRCESKS